MPILLAWGSEFEGFEVGCGASCCGVLGGGVDDRSLEDVLLLVEKMRYVVLAVGTLSTIGVTRIADVEVELGGVKVGRRETRTLVPHP